MRAYGLGKTQLLCIVVYKSSFYFGLLFPPTLYNNMPYYTVYVQEAATQGVNLKSNEMAKSEKHCPTHNVQ